MGMCMGWEAWITVIMVVLMIAALVRNIAGPEIILLGGLTILMTIASITGTDRLPSPTQAVASFGNDGLITVAVLYVVTAGLIQTGAVNLIAGPIMGRPKSLTVAQGRMMLPVAGLSAFLNNTPVVAMMMPVVNDMCRKYNFSASKLFIPLSYASIVGGTCTLIGTSTNLVVYGMLDFPVDPNTPDFLVRDQIGLFTIAWVGLPVAGVVFIYILLFSPKLLPDRATPRTENEDPRHYTVEMLVEPGSGIIGKSIEEAGLRNLPGAYLMEIEREGERLVAVGPEEKLEANDRLIFVGVVESVVDLQKIRGLTPATEQVFKLSDPRRNRVLVEAVVSPSCPLIGKTIRAGQFRTKYNGVVIAVHRHGQRLTNKKIGDIVLQSGDTLLIETHPRFLREHRDSRDFYLVSNIPGSQPMRHERAWIALGVLGVMVLLAGTGILSMLNAALLAAGFMVILRCTSPNQAHQSIEWRVLMVIGSALGIGLALDRSGAATAIANSLVSLVQGNPWLVLLMVYLVTTLFTELITNNAAAVLMVPIAKAATEELSRVTGEPVSILPFAIAIMVAASASFSTPIGYQTNLMVYGPGGYRFTDYMRIGIPLNIMVMAITVTLAPMIWSFST
jgi:di/tricarboxylate transporter